MILSLLEVVIITYTAITSLIDKKWIILLQEKRRTCNIDIPFGKSENPNVKLAFRAKSIDICARDVTTLTGQDPAVRYFFWSPKFPSNTNHVMANLTVNANCYAFKSCNRKERVSLMVKGTTYKLREGKFYHRCSQMTRFRKGITINLNK